MDQPDCDLQLLGLRCVGDPAPDPRRSSQSPADVQQTLVLATEDEDASLTLLERLDRRQNQVLKELDRLNERIECLVVQCQDERQSPRAA